MKTITTFSVFTARMAMTTLVLLFSSLSARADLSGKCGTNLYYDCILSTRTLKIYIGSEGSTGSMTNFDEGDNLPWRSAREVIRTVIIGEGVTNIGDNAFHACYALTDVKISDSVTDIGNNAFNYCKNLTSIVIPDNVTRIGKATFSNCWNLPSVNLPDNLVTIEDHAFEGCSSLTSLSLPLGVTDIGNGAFYGCHRLTSFTIPKGVKSIGKDTFRACTNMTSVSIPEGVMTIDEYAFSFCLSLTSVTIPSSVTSIGKEAFGYCSSLSTVYCYVANPPTIDISFTLNASGRKIYVPAECLATYQESWSDYRNDIVGMPVYIINLEESPDETSGTASVSTNVAAQGDKVTLTATPKPGYRFVWWDASGGAVVEKPSAEQTTLTMPGHGITVTAMFRGTDDNPETYTLTLEENDGNPYGMAESHKGIKSHILPTRTRTSYYFLGWATSATGNPAYQAGDTINLEHNLTLYACWMKVPVELADNANNVSTLTKLIELNDIDVNLNNRSFVVDGNWNTLVLPFDLPVADIPHSNRFATVVMELDTEGNYDGMQTGFDSSTGTLCLNFKEVTDTLRAGIPFIIKWGSTSTDGAADIIPNPTFSEVKVTRIGTIPVTSSDGVVNFIGTFNPVQFFKDDESVLFMGEDNTLHYPNADFTLKTLRAYFRLETDHIPDASSSPRPVKAFILNFAGDNTSTGIYETVGGQLGIGQVVNGQKLNGKWYDLTGRRLSSKPAAPGIYINNGKKVIIK